MSGKNVGIRDVAAAAGVSATTVSHVLNDVVSARISPETRERVRSAAGQLGYGPDSVARALRTNRTTLLGLVIEDVGASPHAGQIILGADDAARARGYNLLILNTSGSAGPESRESDVGSLLARRVDGILYAPGRHRQLQLPANLASVPAVLLGSAGSAGSIAAVMADDDDAIRAAADCLAAAGHTRIGFIDNTSGLEQGGHAAAARILAGEDPPTGLVCTDAAMAMGVYRAAAELGLAIPADLSVIALSDHDVLAENLHPALTTVTLPRYEMAVRATEILIDAIEEKVDLAVFKQHPAVFAWTLTARGSVAPPGLSATPRGNF
ncbi:MAG: LacI family transcriptional regulator [Pseudarthrobacter sp.]|nr:LacI family transcriptional regulator [Pseudarthrobacter sp.]